jgi:predicted DNA-binding transcriptional regulator AlpA
MRNFDSIVHPLALPPQERLLRLDDVRKIIPLSRPTIYRRIQEGKFPAPLKDGRCSLWEESKVRAYAEQLAGQQF